MPLNRQGQCGYSAVLAMLQANIVSMLKYTGTRMVSLKKVMFLQPLAAAWFSAQIARRREASAFACRVFLPRSANSLAFGTINY